MAIDLLSLEPTVITRDLSNKYILLAAPYKFGKTTFMTKIPGALILSFEPGLNAHAGVYAQKITTWNEMKQVVTQLKKQEVKDRFKTVCFDTVDLAAMLCQEFVCSQNGVQSLGDVPFGKAYGEYEKEFKKTLLTIANLGYGCVFACHTEIKEVQVDEKTITERIQPKLDKRAFDVINRLVDIIGIGVMEFGSDGTAIRKLYTRETPTIKAGNRFGYFPAKIDFDYDSVVLSLCEAIEKEGELNQATIVDKIEVDYEEFDFAKLRQQAKELWDKLISAPPTQEEKEEVANTILKKLEILFGRKIKLSEITEDQVALLADAVDEMRAML